MTMTGLDPTVEAALWAAAGALAAKAVELIAGSSARSRASRDELRAEARAAKEERDAEVRRRREAEAAASEERERLRDLSRACSARDLEVATLRAALCRRDETIARLRHRGRARQTFRDSLDVF